MKKKKTKKTKQKQKQNNNNNKIKKIRSVLKKKKKVLGFRSDRTGLKNPVQLGLKIGN